MRAAAAVPDSRAFNGVGYAGPGVGHAFTAQIEECGLVIELGAFDSAEEAARRYDVYAGLLHGTHAVLNYAPEEPDDEPATRRTRPRGGASARADAGDAPRGRGAAAHAREQPPTAGRWHRRGGGAAESEDGPSRAAAGGGLARAPAYDDELIDDAPPPSTRQPRRRGAALDAASGVRAHVAVVDALNACSQISTTEEPA